MRNQDNIIYHENKDNVIYQESKDNVIYHENKDNVIYHENKDNVIYQESKDNIIYQKNKDNAIYQDKLDLDTDVLSHETRGSPTMSDRNSTVTEAADGVGGDETETGHLTDVGCSSSNEDSKHGSVTSSKLTGEYSGSLTSSILMGEHTNKKTLRSDMTSSMLKSRSIRWIWRRPQTRVKKFR